MGYNLLFRWFLDMELEEESFDATVFSKNRDRLMEHEVGRLFFDAVVETSARSRTDERRSFHSGRDLDRGVGESEEVFDLKEKIDRGTKIREIRATVGWTSTARNAAMRPMSRRPIPRVCSARKGSGKEAKLCYGAHALMENRNGLLVDLKITQATGTAEWEAAEEMIKRQRRKGVRVKSLERTRTTTLTALLIFCAAERSFPMWQPTPGARAVRPLTGAPHAIRVTASVNGYERELKRFSAGPRRWVDFGKRDIGNRENATGGLVGRSGV